MSRYISVLTKYLYLGQLVPVGPLLQNFAQNRREHQKNDSATELDIIECPHRALRIKTLMLAPRYWSFCRFTIPQTVKYRIAKGSHRRGIYNRFWRLSIGAALNEGKKITWKTAFRRSCISFDLLSRI